MEERLRSLESTVAKLIELSGLQAAEIERLRLELTDVQNDMALNGLRRQQMLDRIGTEL